MNNQHSQAILSIKSIKICRVVTVPITFTTLLHKQIKALLDSNNIEIVLVSSPGEELESIGHELSIRTCPVQMSRQISPISDIQALVRLIRLFRKERFDVVHSSTPKAGLLAAVAGRFTNSPIRIHTFTGQPWVEMQGWRRLLGKTSDYLIGKLNTMCYADSQSQLRFLVDEAVITHSHIKVLGSGSISGVDFDRFNPDLWNDSRTESTRRELGIESNACVILFVGRITRDKGVMELISAFQAVSALYPTVELVIIGPIDQEHGCLTQDTLNQLRSNPKIHTVGFTREPERYLAIGDIFCLPSYREGFGSVIIEAAAMELPAVATTVTGLVDAVVDGVTGILVPPKDITTLRDALIKMVNEPDLRRRMGQAARERACRDYDANKVNQLVVDEYFRLVGVDL
jgi:glycosyltransferase involved in cell wall biosynthesis